MKLKHVFGNVLKVDIPLTVKIRTLKEGGCEEKSEDFYPNQNMPCTILLEAEGKKYPYTATVNGNVAHFEDNGKLGKGTYNITVNCYDTDGNPYRYMQRYAIEIVNATADAGINPGIEFNAQTHTLEGAVFFYYTGKKQELVNADWNETDETKPSFILNKPEHIVKDDYYVHTDNNYSYEDKQKVRMAITRETDPTVPDWAKQPNKPSYSALEVGALPANTSLFSGDYNDLENKPIIPDTSNFVDGNNLAPVAFSGSYNDLINTPPVPAALVNSNWNATSGVAEILNKPTNVSAFNNDAGYLIQQDISGKEDKSNKVTSWQLTPDNTHYPSEKLVKDSIDGVDNVFVAEFGVTTGSDVTAAINAGKAVFCIREVRVYHLSTTNGEWAYFGGNGDTISLKISTSAWSRSTGGIENTNNKKTAITGNESSNTYYPTTKAVADYAQKKMEIVVASGTTPSAAIDTYYSFASEVGTLAITFPAVTDTTHISNIVFMLTTGSTPAVTFTAPSGINVIAQDGFSIEASTTYEINAIFNGVAWIVAAMKLNTTDIQPSNT